MNYTWVCALSNYKYKLGTPTYKLPKSEIARYYNDKWYEVYKDDDITILFYNYDQYRIHMSITTNKRIQHIPKKFHEMLQLQLDIHKIK